MEEPIARAGRRLASSLLSIIAAVVLSLLAATADGRAAEPPVVNDAASEAQMGRVTVGEEALDFTLETIDGATLRLSELRGEKNAILIFFRGTW